MLFSEKARTLEGGKLPGMGPYTYLDQLAMPVAAAVRSQLEGMLSRYPETDRSDLAARLRIDVEGTHNSAFFELALHELMTRNAAFRLAAVEPEVPGVPTKPDFQFVDGDGLDFFLEAALATGVPAAEAKRLLKRDKVLSALYGVQHPTLKFRVRNIKLPQATASARAIQRAVTARLDQLALDAAVIPTVIEELLHIDRRSQV